MRLVQIHLIFFILNKIAIITNFLAFFVFILKNFPRGSGSAYWMWIRIRERKRMQIHADPDPQPWFRESNSCGSGSWGQVPTDLGSRDCRPWLWWRLWELARGAVRSGCSSSGSPAQNRYTAKMYTKSRPRRIAAFRAVDKDPHSLFLLDPDPYSEYGSDLDPHTECRSDPDPNSECGSDPDPGRNNWTKKQKNW